MDPDPPAERADIDWSAALELDAPDMAIVLNESFAMIWRSRSASTLTGVSDEAARSVEPANRFHPDDLADFIGALAATRRTRTSQPVTFRMSSPTDGHWLECSGWVGDLSHVATGHVLVRVRILSQHEADWAGADTVDPFLALTEGSSLGYSLVGEFGRIGYRNPAFAQWFPVDRVQQVDQLAHMVRPVHRPAVQRWVEDLMAGRDEGITVAVDGPDGETWLDLEAATRSTAWSRTTVGITAHDVTRLRYEATHDHLSGLLNRAAVIEALDSALSEARADDTTVGALFCDLDNFKLVNDALGHEVGDELLRRIADRIAGAVRSGDLVGRLGGDEFLVVSRAVGGEEQLVGLASRIARAVADDLRGTPFPVSLSIGAAVAPEGRSTAGALVRDADAAMYRAKSSGKSRTELFRPEMRDRAERHLEVGRLLRVALDEHWMTVHYQPVFEHRDGRWELHALEALARCPLPDGTWLTPDEFIPVAEQTGLIGRLGRRIRLLVANDVQRWSDLHQRPVTVWVNMSVQELDRAGLATRFVDRIVDLGLDPRQVGVEVTESALASGHPDALASLAEFRAHGVRVIIDDFGMGYSSLGAVKDYPADVIKIDRSFVSGVLDAPGDLAIVRSINEIGRVSGLQVVAEGVETAAQLDAIVQVGCTSVQGFHMARPMPASSVDEQIGGWIRGHIGSTATGV